MAAPKGNLFAIGNHGGRPPIYETPDAIFKAISDYIDYEDEGKPGKGKYTLEGCALFLGFASVQSLYDYEKRSEEFSYVLARFRLWMVDYHVKGLKWGGTYAGSVFWLKNKGGYSDESVQHQIQTITQVQPQVINPGVALSSSEKDVE